MCVLSCHHLPSVKFIFSLLLDWTNKAIDTPGGVCVCVCVCVWERERERERQRQRQRQTDRQTDRMNE